MRRRLKLRIRPQPDDTTCGPTCLHAVYRYYNDSLPLRRLIGEVSGLETGGTLAVQLACHALERGYHATIYTYNLHLFDPTWFDGSGRDIPARLRLQAAAKRDRKLRAATRAYLEFFALGGRLEFTDLTPALIRGHLDRGRPILTGLSATYLYGCARETGDTVLSYDDVRGVPTGHFVVLHGYRRKRREVLVADPFHENPRFNSHTYVVGIERVLGAILLGVVTYDANLLIVEPPGRTGSRR